ncbi:MAG: cbb3-type cytochrome c oxidase subunit I [Gemmatimonadaceae bacterium]
MTSLVRRFLKTAILFLIAGLAIGIWMLVERELTGRLASPYVRSAHTHAILVGFVMMMILGVALWMFPRPAKDDTRYRPRVAGMAYWLIAAGTAARVVGELAHARSDDLWLRWLVIIAGLMQVAGLVAFFATMWSRIRAVGSVAREESGERF